MKFSGKVENGSMKKRLNFGGDIRIATQVRRALAEVCTFPVLLVVYCGRLMLCRSIDLRQYCQLCMPTTHHPMS